jgi:hypothetical protein
MGEREMKQIAKWIAQVSSWVLRNYKLPKEKQQRSYFWREYNKKIVNDEYLRQIAVSVRELAGKFPLFAE